MTSSPFCAEYLRAQGVQILDPVPREKSVVVTERRREAYVPVVNQYGRDT